MIFPFFKKKKHAKSSQNAPYRVMVAPQWQYASNAVSAERSLTLSTVWACVKLISETISTLPLKIYERDADGNKKAVAYQHPLNQLLCVSPNAYQTPSKFFEFIAASILLRGNAYLQKHYIGNRLVALTPILPQNIERIELIDNVPHYTFTDHRFNQTHRQTLPESQIWHLRGFGIDGMLGLNPLLVGADVLGNAKSAETIASKTFGNGLNTSGVFNYKNGFLTKDQRAKFKAELQEFAGESNAGKVLLLENGVEYQQISLNPETAQLLESRAYGVEEICRLFMVQPILIGHSSKSSSWGSSIESLYMLYATNTIRPMLVNFEQSIRKNLISASERENTFAEFNLEGLLRGDTASRTAYYQSAVNNGYMTRNEVRAKENMPPLAGGDALTVQSAMIPLDDVGKNYN